MTAKIKSERDRTKQRLSMRYHSRILRSGIVYTIHKIGIASIYTHWVHTRCWSAKSIHIVIASLSHYVCCTHARTSHVYHNTQLLTASGVLAGRHVYTHARTHGNKRIQPTCLGIFNLYGVHIFLLCCCCCCVRIAVLWVYVCGSSSSSSLSLSSWCDCVVYVCNQIHTTTHRMY